jgi:hypothetical protein
MLIVEFEIPMKWLYSRLNSTIGMFAYSQANGHEDVSRCFPIHRQTVCGYVSRGVM